MSAGGSIKREGDHAVIRVPLEDVHSLRVALRPVKVGETTSSSTQTIRDRLDKGLAQLEARS